MASRSKAMRSAPDAAAAPKALRRLKERLSEIADLGAAASVLSWDQAVFMPPKAAEARGRQLARLSKLLHEKATDKALGKLLDELRGYAEGLDPASDDAALIRVSRRDYERSIRVPTDYTVRATEHGARSYQAWTEARPANDFARMRPLLETTLDLSRELSTFFPGYAHVMDPHIGPEEGLTVAEIDRLFQSLRRRLVPLVKAITAKAPADDSCLRRSYPEERQLAFARRVAEALGYDLARGRIDKSPHPFCSSFHRNDVRITTRVQRNDLSDALFSVLHEVGHALYELGVAEALEGTLLDHGASAGVHESQSRLWENIVARSRPFWRHYLPELQKVFPSQLGSVGLDEFYRAINKVTPSLVRTDADEVTYNLHVMLRFDLEKRMLEGSLEIRDLPEAWNARYASDLGVTPPDDRDGVLQDVHWYAGGIGGYFQGYTIGNILSAQIWEAALAQRPSIGEAIGRGEFGELRSWLADSLHAHGRKFTGPEVVRKATGRAMTIEPYMRYLEGKYGELYALG